jgi:hypothetical protein
VAFTQPQRIGGLVVVCALVGIVATAAIVTGHGSGQPPAAAGMNSAQSPAPAEDSPRPTPSDSVEPVAADPAVQKQLAYTLAHWQDYNLDEYGLMEGNDCVNFVSQSLVERGWEMDDEWWTSGTGMDFDYSSPWVSSTAFMRYLDSSGRATALTDDQRNQVKLGDIAQFDWDNSGDRDHTAIVTRIEGSGDDLEIYYAGHTDDTDYRSVDWAITVNHPGASVYYWSIP